MCIPLQLPIFCKRRMDMSLMPNPTFYPSPGMAMQAPPERIAYVALLNVGKNGMRDAMGVIDLDPHLPDYGHLVDQVDFASGDNELHHFGWNACSACLCPRPRTHIWSAVTSLYPVSDRPGFTFWIPNRIPSIPRS
jgi:hypothetical protein